MEHVGGAGQQAVDNEHAPPSRSALVLGGVLPLVRSWSMARRGSVAPLPSPSAGAGLPTASNNLHLLPFEPVPRTSYRVLLDSDGTTMSEEIAARWAEWQASRNGSHLAGSQAGSLAARAIAVGGVTGASLSPSLLMRGSSAAGTGMGSTVQGPGSVVMREGGHSTARSPPSISTLNVEPGVTLRLEVIDNGRGIPPAAQSHLFSQFAQVAATSGGAAQTATVKGTGLGLFIVKELVERHGGRVGVASTGVPGQPTTFWFEVPVRPVTVVDAEERPPRPPALLHVPATRHVLAAPSAVEPGAEGDDRVGIRTFAGVSRTLLSIASDADAAVGAVDSHAPTHIQLPTVREGEAGTVTDSAAASPIIDAVAAPAVEYRSPLLELPGPHAVVVDDSETVRLMLARRLHKNFPGVAVHVADGGSSALAVLHALHRAGKEPALVLIDYNMPGMSGPDTVRALRALGATAHMIGITGDAGETGNVAAFLAAGCNEVMEKPVNRARIAASVAHLLQAEKHEPDSSGGDSDGSPPPGEAMSGGAGGQSVVTRRGIRFSVVASHVAGTGAGAE